ncbi:hypothetical protein PTKIN_Ptkin06aG0199300 [Pterospermum kingtungense]
MDRIADAVANLVFEAKQAIFEEVKRHGNYKQNVENLEEKMEVLTRKRKSVQQEVDVAERNVKKIKLDVKDWCEKVDKIIDEEGKKVKDLKDKVEAKYLFGLCLDIKFRYQLSRKAAEDVHRLINVNKIPFCVLSTFSLYFIYNTYKLL